VIALARAPAGNGAEWISIREASALIGVSVATLRRWCDAGHVPVFTTPGGHRRFSRDAVLSLLPIGWETRPMAAEGTAAMTIIGGYRRVNRRTWELPEPLTTMDPHQRADLRRHGRDMVAALVDALDAPRPDEATQHARACVAAAACGRIAGECGMTLPQTLAVFVRFRAPFLHGLSAVCQRRALGGPAATALLERASNMIDRLLPAVVTGYESAADLGRQQGGTAS
jgi:excisionase family DNA binding protein